MKDKKCSSSAENADMTTKEIPTSCNRCLEQVMKDATEGKNLKWSEYGQGKEHCSSCLDALKADIEKPCDDLSDADERS